MTMKKPLVIANWKMHGNTRSNAQLISAISSSIDTNSTCNVVLCPPAPFLNQVVLGLADTSISVGAQNMHAAEFGAYTGEISASMLKDLGCTYVLIGHSERRSLFAESDTDIANKYIAAINSGLTPVLCVGESLQERQNGTTEAVVKNQIQAVLDAGGVASFANAVIAYEPVWAIGTGETASPEQAQAVHAAIRQQISALDPEIGENISVLYGGSVKADNAGELFMQKDIDGALVGGASLDAKAFVNICSAAI